MLHLKFFYSNKGNIFISALMGFDHLEATLKDPHSCIALNRKSACLCDKKCPRRVRTFARRSSLKVRTVARKSILKVSVYAVKCALGSPKVCEEFTLRASVVCGSSLCANCKSVLQGSLAHTVFFRLFYNGRHNKPPSFAAKKQFKHQ